MLSMQWMVLLSAFTGIGCSNPRIAIRAVPASRFGVVASQPITATLFVDPGLRTSQVDSTVNAGLARLQCTFELGEALEKTVENAVRAAYPQTRRIEPCRCNDAALLLCVRLAQPPNIHVRWVQRMFTVGGGSTVSLALRIDATDCRSGASHSQVVIGYGSVDREESFANYPGEEEFRPAVDTALAEISFKLDRFLAGLTPPPESTTTQDQEGSTP